MGPEVRRSELRSATTVNPWSHSTKAKEALLQMMISLFVCVQTSTQVAMAASHLSHVLQTKTNRICESESMKIMMEEKKMFSRTK